MTARAPKPPRFHDLPAGLPVEVDLPREEWPADRDNSNTVRMVARCNLLRAPYQDKHGEWFCQVDTPAKQSYPLALVKPQRGHTPPRPEKPKPPPTITLEQLEARAREVIGDAFVRVEIMPRRGRTERVRLCYGPVPPELRDSLKGGWKGRDYRHQITMTKDRSEGDPDASRKSFLKFLDDCTVTARIAAGKLAGTVVEG